jgi:hypothetical protein
MDLIWEFIAASFGFMAALVGMMALAGNIAKLISTSLEAFNQ